MRRTTDLKLHLIRPTAILILISLIGCGQIPNPLSINHPEEYNRGLRRLQARDIPGSQAAFDLAISLHREDLNLYGQIANEYIQADQPALAAKYAEMGLATVPTAPIVERCALLSIASAAQLDAGQHPKALELAYAAYNLQPDNPLVQNGLAYTIAETTEPNDPIAPNNLVKAEGLLISALDKLKKIDIAPDQIGVVLDSFGWVHYKMHRYKDAILELGRANDLAPGQAEITYHLGMAYIGAGMTAEANNTLKRAINIKPGFRAAKLALDSLGQ